MIIYIILRFLLGLAITVINIHCSIPAICSWGANSTTDTFILDLNIPTDYK